MEFLRKNQLWLFFTIALVFAFSMASVSLSSQNEGISILIPLSPSIIAIVMTAFFSSRMGFRKLFIGSSPNLSLQWLAISLFMVPVLAGLAVFIHSLFGGRTFSLLPLNIGNLIGGALLVPLGEEFGWRGYALPRLLKKHSAITASLVLGVIWGVWHYAGHLVGAGVEGLPFVYLFMWILGATILMTWVYNHTGSVWTAILIHSSANLAFNLFPIGPTQSGGPTTFFIFLGLVWLLALIASFRLEPQTSRIDLAG